MLLSGCAQGDQSLKATWLFRSALCEMKVQLVRLPRQCRLTVGQATEATSTSAGIVNAHCDCPTGAIMG